MRRTMRTRLAPLVGGVGLMLCAGCLARRPVEVPCGHLPPPTTQVDSQTSAMLAVMPEGHAPVPPRQPEGAAPPAGKAAFDLPPGLPGADAAPIRPLRFDRDTPLEQRQKAIREAYPELRPVSAADSGAGHTLTLADLQAMALASSPAVRRAQADVAAAYGPVIQAGLRPNPTVGWEADQWKPGTGANNNAGQQGAFLDLMIKTAGKLSLARAVAGFDYLNAQVALRRAEVDVINQVRTLHFSALVARKGVEVNRALVALADEVYGLQLKQLSAGEAAGYEPLQLYAQAVQARNSLIQSEVTYRSAWKQLAVLLGQPDLPPGALAGRADAPAPVFDPDQARALMLGGHTDLLTARNTILQAETNLTLQLRTRVPDLQTHYVIQRDNADGNTQMGVQLGVGLPLSDRNQGNIHQARARIARSREDLLATQNDLQTRLADALGRYETNRSLAENYRDRVMPNLSRAYRAMVRRYQVEPDKVGFGDIVMAQQNLAQSLQNYLSALDAQWKAAVDVAALTQADDLSLPPDAAGCAPGAFAPPS